MKFHPSVKACLKEKCPELVRQQYEGRDRNVCRINGRIPGNMPVCPKEAVQ